MSIVTWLPFFFATPAHTCTTQGAPLLEMRQGSDTSTSPTAITRIFNTGAWTIESAGTTRRGCFDRAELAAIRRAVILAPWQTTHSPVACFAYDPNFTEYRVRGKLRFTERFCSGTWADNKTLAAIELVKHELAEEQPAPPLPVEPPIVEPPPAPIEPKPPVTPPAASCKITGTPMFEIHKLSDVDEATSTIALYSTGAWTYQPIDANGYAGRAKTGCLDKRTTASLYSAIEQAPWDTTFSRIVCRAYSPRSTQYVVDGKLEYTARLCGAERLDPTSLGAIKQVEAAFVKLLPAQATISDW